MCFGHSSCFPYLLSVSQWFVIFIYLCVNISRTQPLSWPAGCVCHYASFSSLPQAESQCSLFHQESTRCRSSAVVRRALFSLIVEWPTWSIGMSRKRLDLWTCWQKNWRTGMANYDGHWRLVSCSMLGGRVLKGMTLGKMPSTIWALRKSCGILHLKAMILSDSGKSIQDTLADDVCGWILLHNSSHHLRLILWPRKGNSSLGRNWKERNFS